MSGSRFTLLLLPALCAPFPAFAQPNFSGHWAPEPYVHNIPPAQLVEGITAQVLTEQGENDAYAIRWCNAIGMPALMNYTLDIRQMDRYMVISSEGHSYSRFVYFEQAPRDPEILDPSSVGYSDGRWEGETLVVESYGFAGFDPAGGEGQQVKGLTAIPGGGFRSPSSHLVERFRLTNNGQVLIVESVWTDPAVFATPHAYSFRYLRRDANYEPPIELYCDPFDAERTEFLQRD